MNITKFEEILNNTTIPAGLGIDEQEKRIAPLKTHIQKVMPDKLYKYRSFCDNHISAFYKDQLWASSAQSMNDGFDARLYYDKSKCLDIYRQQTSSEQIETFINKLKTNETLREELSKMPGAERALPFLDLPDEIIKQGIEESRSRLTPVIMNMLENLPSITQQALKFCCLSETVTSASMWGQYADNERGFCIEYDFKTANSVYFTPAGIHVNTSLYPMIYKENRYEVSAEFINYLMQYRISYENAVNASSNEIIKTIKTQLNHSLRCPDLLVSTKIALHKSLEWQFEKEWRLFCNAVDDNDFEQASHGCIIKSPKAVYLGRRISEVNEIIMRAIAKEKDIPVYKMMLDDDSSSYELKYK